MSAFKSFFFGASTSWNLKEYSCLGAAPFHRSLTKQHQGWSRSIPFSHILPTKHTLSAAV
jgi:hypothetical protein